FAGKHARRSTALQEPAYPRRTGRAAALSLRRPVPRVRARVPCARAPRTRLPPSVRGRPRPADRGTAPSRSLPHAALRLRGRGDPLAPRAEGARSPRAPGAPPGRPSARLPLLPESPEPRPHLDDRRRELADAPRR